MKKTNANHKTSRYPFIIHGAPTIPGETYPTHTHHLNDNGWPEFMIDPMVFGPEGNALRINAAYMYFKNPNRKKKLRRIMKGEVIELTEKQLLENKDGSPSRVICFRRVPDDFEGAKLAYPNWDGVNLNKGIIQLYVKGDEFVLTDEYYANGVTW